MKPTDILPIEKWIELEKDIYNRSKLSASVFNTEGIRITDYFKWPNKICPAIKATDKGKSFICATAHMNLANIAKNTKKFVIEECDAGLVKLIVPIFVQNKFIGSVGACGLILEDGEVDTFAINMITEIEEKKAEELSAGIASISKKNLEELAQYIKARLKAIIK
ncbi:MAG: PocR ligand-binding domain-containing protein [Deltaproteobacteria bacterium]|nr:PocR ligand-binding domain-containing protein [Deltaproteobacteria bacterium]